MKTEIINTLILAASFLALFTIAECLYHFLNIKVELTRKLVHLGTGLLTLLFPIVLNNHWLVLVLCTSFAVILLLSLRFQFLKSINAIDRKSYGSLAYPVSVYICYLAFNVHQQYICFYLPIIILAICDPIAALTGKKWPMGKYKVGKDNKTLMGSGMFLISAMLVCFSLFFLLDIPISYTHLAAISFFIALVSCITEAISRNGYDNLTIPISVLSMLIGLNQF
jgi:phytol kinase